MKNVSYSEVDSLIITKNSESLDSFLESFALAVAPIRDAEIENDPKSILFNEKNEKDLQRFIACCFIRMLATENSAYINDPSIKFKVYQLIQKSLPDVCNLAKVNDKTETYNKEVNLKAFLKDREKELDEKLYFGGDLGAIKTFQQNYRQTVNSNKHKIFLAFVGSLISKPNLDTIFQKIEYYLEADEEEKYKAYSSVDDSLQNYIEEAYRFNTAYVLKYIINPFKQVLEALKADINKSPFFIPCSLTIEKTEKKYPLTIGAKNSFRIRVCKTGGGYAQEVSIKSIHWDDKSINIVKKEQFIGSIKAVVVVIEFPYECIQNIESIKLNFSISWISAGDNLDEKLFEVTFEAQASDIDWESITEREPYNLEPVEYSHDLIGRDSILSRLTGMTKGIVGSSYIFGQRRVGKTSIVKTLINSAKNESTYLIYIEAGDWNDANSPFNSMNNLGRKICKKIARLNSKFKSVEIPTFEGSLNKISDFFDDITDIDSNANIVIILDEFDRISRALYERGEVGKSFVLTLRAISNRSQYGFILVGGENLEYILAQWQDFNKFKSIRVDYFSKENDWDDFSNLIRIPVIQILDISDSAINLIYDETSGNPYFTKMICAELYRQMIDNRDTHVTDKEALKAIVRARNSANIAATDFSHFWEDGIKVNIEKEEETSLKRRKILIAIISLIHLNNKVTKENICKKAIDLNLSASEVEKFLTEFEKRIILHENNGEYAFVVPFFKKWLLSGGVDKIIATFEEEERVLITQKKEEEERVKPEEITKLINQFSEYKGSKLTSEIIHEWLSQFESISSQRLVFQLLQNFKLYTDLEIRNKLENMFLLVRRKMNREGKIKFLEAQKKKRGDILITYLDDSPAKGGGYYTKLFADTNGIYAQYACVPHVLEKKIQEIDGLNCLVIIDDIIGSGTTAKENIKKYFTPAFCETLRQKEIIVVFGFITGFSESKEIIENELEQLHLNFSVELVDILNENDKCFSQGSKIFMNESEMERAKSICLQKGEILERKHPLGYSNSELLIAFPANCPNNTLPIFWKRTKDWIPLFERKM